MGCGTSMSSKINPLPTTQVSIVHLPSSIVNAVLDLEQCRVISDTWRSVILKKMPDICHKVWMRAIQKSPKLNEIICLGQFCVRDLTKWPKLNKLAEAQRAFYERLIFDFHLEKELCHQAAIDLGKRHFFFAKYGVQPVYFDIYNLSFGEVLQQIKLTDEQQNTKNSMVRAWHKLINIISECMAAGYLAARKEAANCANSVFKNTTLLSVKDNNGANV